MTTTSSPNPNPTTQFPTRLRPVARRLPRSRRRVRRKLRRRRRIPLRRPVRGRRGRRKRWRASLRLRRLSLEGPLLLKVSQLRRDVARSSRISQMKGKKRSRKSAPSKSPGEASTETPAKVLIDKLVKPSMLSLIITQGSVPKVCLQGDCPCWAFSGKRFISIEDIS